MDDIIIHSNTFEDHLNRLREILEAHRKAGMKIAPAKSELFRSEVKYLGHRVSAKGIAMVDEYVQLVLDWPKPTTGKELASFLGKTGYYRSFIKCYSKIAACLEAEKLKEDLVWTPKMNKAFEILKQAFREKPILAFPEYNSKEPFIFYSDWCQEGMSQTLSQNQTKEDGYRERLIACGGRKCTEAERNYSSNKGETCSFVDGLKRFEHMLRYAPL